jgi:hypothetical protein
MRDVIWLEALITSLIWQAQEQGQELELLEPERIGSKERSEHSARSPES